MHLGIALPFGDIGGDGPIVRGYAWLAEAGGYGGLTLADHVLGGTPANPASGRAGGLGLFHDPFVAFGFIAACTKKVELSTQVLILAQRQTVLVAKQAASLDVLSGGRFRFGIGVGWNEMEFVGLNENFHNRGKRSEEQVQVMKALWADPYVTFEGKWHRLPDAGINPWPPSRNIPLLFGGHMDVTLQRIAKWGDGWMMLSEPPGPKAVAEFDKLRRLVEAEGRDPASVGLEVWTSTGTGTERDWREEISFWKKAGVTYVTLHNTFGGDHDKGMVGRTMSDHVNNMSRYRIDRVDLHYGLPPYTAPGIGERGQHAVASSEIAVGVDRLQTDMRGAGREVRPQPAPDRLGVTPQYHRIDEPVIAAVGQLSLGKALTEPAVAIIRQHHVTRQFLASERPRLRGIGFKRDLLLHCEPLRRPEYRGRLSRVLRRHVVWDSAT